MSSLFGLAEQLLSQGAGTGGGEAGPGGYQAQPQQYAHKTGGYEYNSPYQGQQPQGTFDTQEVLSHAGDLDEEGQGYIAQAIQHVHNNPQQHQKQVDEGDLSKYGPAIFNALSSVSSKSGLDVGSLVSGGLSRGGGNQLMGLVMKEAGNAFSGGGVDKQSAMNGAAMTLTKLVAQNQLSGFVGGSNSGGLGMLSEVGETLLKSRFG